MLLQSVSLFRGFVARSEISGQRSQISPHLDSMITFNTVSLVYGHTCQTVVEVILFIEYKSVSFNEIFQ